MATDGVVTCQACGQTVRQRECCGVKRGGAWVWTCADCIRGGGLDRVFGPVGETVRTIIAATQRVGDRADG